MFTEMHSLHTMIAVPPLWRGCYATTKKHNSLPMHHLLSRGIGTFVRGVGVPAEGE